jgi:hypothetical protein
MPSIGRWTQGLRLVAIATAVLAIGWGCAEQPTEESNGIVVDDQGHTRSGPSPVAPFGEMHIRPIRPTDLARGGPMLVADSSSSGKAHFIRLVRYPTEQQTFVTMQNDTAFSRDMFTGTDWFVQGAQDGDSWNVSFTLANGSVVTGPDLRFVSVLGSETDCFISGLSHLCGFTGIFVESYFTSQCGTTGPVRVTFTENSGTWGSDTFYLKNQIDSASVPTWNQNAFSDQAYDNQCTVTDVDGYVDCARDASGALKPGYTTASIGALGCAITTAVNALTYHGMTTDPGTLNTWLTSNGGYSGGAIMWTKIPSYAQSLGSNMELVGAYSVPKIPTDADFNRLKQIMNTTICRYGLGSAQVRYLDANNKPHKHWVSPYGRSLDSATYLISNPAGQPTGEHNGRFGVLSDVYSNKIYRLMVWQQLPTATLAAIEVHGHSPIEYFLTDPLGHRLGVDPTTGQQYSEIPDADYSIENLTSDLDGEGGSTHPSIEALVPHPVDGTYQLQVTGTDTGMYSLSILTTASDGSGPTTEIPSTPTWVGAVHNYSFNFSSSGGSGSGVTRGGFAGGGQSAEADQLITYAVPGTKSTSVPAGVTSVPIVLFLDPGVDPNTVSLIWNGVEVRPAVVTPGTSVRLNLTLAPGRNVFLASANGTINGRPKADQDRLVLTR